MGVPQQPTANRDAGGAAVSSPRRSPGRGPSDAPDARPRTGPSDPLVAALDDLISVSTPRVGRPCSVRVALESMPEEAAEKVRYLLVTPRPDGSLVPVSLIVDTLRRFGYPLSAGAVYNHRRGVLGKPAGCLCER